MENKGAAEAVQQAPAPEKEVASAAPVASCFRKTVGDDATFVESAKDRWVQFKDAPAREHWSCLKNSVVSMFGGEPKVGSMMEGGAKEEAKKIPPV